MRTYRYIIAQTHEKELIDYLRDARAKVVEEKDTKRYVFPSARTHLDILSTNPANITVDIRTDRVYFSERGLRRILRKVDARLASHTLYGRENIWLRNAVPLLRANSL